MNLYHDARDYAHDYRLNPDVQEQWLSCEKCRAWMMPLAKYRIEDEEFAPPSADGT
jgi:hypothetical protein